MLKKLIVIPTIILTIFHTSAISAMNVPLTSNPMITAKSTAIDIIDHPNAAALNILVNALSALKDLKKHGKGSDENIKKLIQIKLLPNLAINTATELALRKHWQQLTKQQQSLFQKYIIQSLIRDYSGILGAYKRLDNVNISTDADVKRKDNKAIVKLIINFGGGSESARVALKMIRLDAISHWRIYDVVFSGVSLIKNYRAQFNSHIKRKGLDSLVNRISEKINQ